MPRVKNRTLLLRKNALKASEAAQSIRDNHEKNSPIYTKTKVQEREIQLVHSKLRSGTTQQIIEKRKNQQNALLFQSENFYN